MAVAGPQLHAIVKGLPGRQRGLAVLTAELNGEETMRALLLTAECQVDRFLQLTAAPISLLAIVRGVFLFPVGPAQWREAGAGLPLAVRGVGPIGSYMHVCSLAAKLLLSHVRPCHQRWG